MKIFKVSFKNINNLALFNKIPRFKGSISKNAIEGLGSVITHHTSDAYARLEYEIKGIRYTSEWITKNTKAGKFVDYDMYIYDVNGKPLDLKKSEVPARNEEIIGLKYDQFVKSIILSQGQFAKFLKANKDERGQLLENLTGSSIYRKIGRATFERFRTIKNEVALEKDRLENIACLSQEERDMLSNEIANLSKLKEEVDSVLTKELALKQIKTDIAKAKSDIDLRKKEQQLILDQEANFVSSKKKLEIYDKLAPLRGEITRSQDAQKKSASTLQLITGTKQKLSAAEIEYQNAISGMGNLTQQKVDGNNFSEIMSAFEKEVNTLDQEIKHIIAKGSDVRTRISQKSQKSRIDFGAKPSPAAAISILNNKMDEAKGIIEAAGLNSRSNVKETREMLSLDMQNLQSLKGISHGHEHELELTQKIQEYTKLEDTYKEEITKYEPLVKVTDELLISTKEKIELLERRKQDELLVASLTDHRSKLEDGKPCPLCGAEHHPWAEHKPKEANQIDEQINETRTKLNECQSNLKQYSSALTTSKTAYGINQKQLQTINEDLKNTKAVNQKLVNEYKGELSTKANEIVESIQKIESKITILNQAVNALESINVMEELLSDFHEMEKVTADFKKTDTKRKSKYSGQNVSADCNALQDKYVNAKTRVATYKSRLEESEKSLTEAKEVLVKSEAILKPKLQALGFDEVSTVNSFLISESELAKLKSQSEEIAKSKTAISTQLETLSVNLQKLQKRDTAQNVPLAVLSQQVAEKEIVRDQYIKEGAAKSALLKKDNEEQERQKNKAKELEKLNQKLEKWDLLNKMIGDKNGNKFANFAQGLTLQNLLVFANKRLQNLSDRYLLNKPVADGPLTVMDQYQGNIQRSVTTLSGGESFLISLALALSLSDMASKNVKLQSLFIDEGFGTLDQETLEVAMNTLEKLQTESQKTVGVISHVETLKERINVQIKLQKDAMGYSSILIES